MKKILLIILFLMLSGSAWASFPTTPILDNFNRANQGPPPSANWSWIFSGSNLAEVKSDACVGTLTSNDNEEYWTPTSFGANQEVYFTIHNWNATDQFVLWLDLSDIVSQQNPDGYELAVTNQATNNWVISKSVSPSTSTALATFTNSTSIGDVIGFQNLNGKLTAYDNGVAVGSTTDSSYKSGYIGFDILPFGNNLDTGFTNFGGGTQVGRILNKAILNKCNI